MVVVSPIVKDATVEEEEEGWGWGEDEVFFLIEEGEREDSLLVCELVTGDFVDTGELTTEVLASTTDVVFVEALGWDTEALDWGGLVTEALGWGGLVTEALGWGGLVTEALGWGGLVTEALG